MGSCNFHDLWLVIIGGIISLVSTVAVTWFTHCHERREESKRLQNAFAGEISALLSIIQFRDYIKFLETLIQDSNNNSMPVIKVTGEYFQVYKQNVDKIGILKRNLAFDIPTFYTQCFSILEDLNQPPDLQPEDCQRMLKELLALFTKTKKLGEKIIDEIHADC